MYEILCRLNKIANRLDELNRSDLADKIDDFSNIIKNAYKARFKVQIKGRGKTKLRRQLYYLRNKYKIKLKTKLYRTKRKPLLKTRKKFKHFKRV